MNFIKQYWKEILIGLLIVFSMNKCTVACNRSTKLNKKEIELSKKDSVIRVKTDSLEIIKVRWNDAQTSQSTYQGIATSNQREMINEIESLKTVINENNITINKLKKENQKLKSK